ncbi:MAG: hypothetical protein AAFU70_12700, partial [Planctomycetota bacterium]
TTIGPVANGTHAATNTFGPGAIKAGDATVDGAIMAALQVATETVALRVAADRTGKIEKIGHPRAAGPQTTKHRAAGPRTTKHRAAGPQTIGRTEVVIQRPMRVAMAAERAGRAKTDAGPKVTDTDVGTTEATVTIDAPKIVEAGAATTEATDAPKIVETGGTMSAVIGAKTIEATDFTMIKTIDVEETVLRAAAVGLGAPQTLEAEGVAATAARDQGESSARAAAAPDVADVQPARRAAAAVVSEALPPVGSVTRWSH